MRWRIRGAWWCVLILLGAGLEAGACAQGITPDDFGDDDDGVVGGSGGGGGAGGEAACAADELWCGDQCVDPETDLAHCGSCDHDCGDNAECVHGDCQCVGITQDCGGVCVDIGTDIFHCGSCNSPCAGAAQGSAACVGGVCGLECEDGWGDCDDDLQTGCEANTDASAVHCGDCDSPCPATVDHGTASCQAGVCTLSCEPDWDDCDDDVATGCETALMSDPDHCTACNTPCQQDWVCYNGSCIDGCAQTIPGFVGELGPSFQAECWIQCEGYLDQPGGDEIPLTWGDDCVAQDHNLVRIVCGASTSSYRYIDVNKNPFRDGLAAFPEVNLITDARDQNGVVFTYSGNEIYADGDHPHNDTSWWAGGDGCSGGASNLTINNIPSSCEEVENCFGQAVAGARYLWVYVKDQ